MRKPHMATYTISLDKTFQKKAEIIRDRCYPTMDLESAIKEFFKDSINGKISDEEVMK
jgi:hypothetical protein